MSELAKQYRTALVTGASTGLGRAMAGMLLDEGVRVWGTAREPSRLPVREGLTALALDLRSDASVDTAWAEADRAAGGFDLAILDVNLGGDEVFPVAETLKTARIPFIFASGYGKGGLPQDWAAYPVAAKPFLIDDLDTALAQAMA